MDTIMVYIQIWADNLTDMLLSAVFRKTDSSVFIRGKWNILKSWPNFIKQMLTVFSAMVSCVLCD